MSEEESSQNYSCVGSNYIISVIFMLSWDNLQKVALLFRKHNINVDEPVQLKNKFLLTNTPRY